MTVLATNRPCNHAKRRPSLRAFIASIIATRRERAALARLDADALSDIGMSRTAAKKPRQTARFGTFRRPGGADRENFNLAAA